MKLYIFFLSLFLCATAVKAQPPKARPLGTDFSYSRSGNDFWFYLFTEFAFGSGGEGGPKISGYLEQKSNDTLYLKALYNMAGVWAAWYSYSKDTIPHIRTDMSIRYFNISTNIYYYNEETGTKTDTAWNERDTTFEANPTSLSEVSGSIDFSIFPNPSKGIFTITQTHVFPNATQRNEGSLHAIVYDLLGRIVYRQAVTFSNNTTSVKVNVAPGVYILELADAAGNAARQRIAIE